MARPKRRDASEAAGQSARAQAQAEHERNLQRQKATGRPLVGGFPLPPTVPVGWVALSTDNNLLVTAILDGPAQRASWDAGWENVDRPGNRKALDHTQDDLEGWTLPILFEGYASDTSQEAQITALYAMARKPSRTEIPPRVRVSGVGPISRRESWVILTVEAQAGDDVMTQWGRSRSRTRARFDVTISERELPELVRIRPAKATRDSSGAGKGRTTIVRSGDTLQRIALRERGDASLWRELAKLNKIRDPSRPPVGRRIKLGA